MHQGLRADCSDRQEGSPSGWGAARRVGTRQHGLAAPTQPLRAGQPADPASTSARRAARLQGGHADAQAPTNTSTAPLPTLQLYPTPHLYQATALHCRQRCTSRIHLCLLQGEHLELALKEVGVGGHIVEAPGGDRQVEAVADACGHRGWLRDGCGLLRIGVANIRGCLTRSGIQQVPQQLSAASSALPAQRRQLVAASSAAHPPGRWRSGSSGWAGGRG